MYVNSGNIYFSNILKYVFLLYVLCPYLSVITSFWIYFPWLLSSSNCWKDEFPSPITSTYEISSLEFISGDYWVTLYICPYDILVS